MGHYEYLKMLFKLDSSECDVIGRLPGWIRWKVTTSHSFDLNEYDQSWYDGLQD